MDPKTKRSSGFTLLEVMFVAAVIGLIASMILASGVGVSTATDLDRAKTQAALMVAARDQYVREYQSTARSAWAAAGTDQAKFSLISTYMGLPSSAALTSVLPSDYTIALGSSVSDDITLWQGSKQVFFLQ